MITCLGCKQRIWFWQNTGKNIFWHKNCDIAYAKGYKEGKEIGETTIEQIKSAYKATNQGDPHYYDSLRAQAYRDFSSPYLEDELEVIRLAEKHGYKLTTVSYSFSTMYHFIREM